MIPVDQEKLFHKIDGTGRCEFFECRLRKFHECRQRADKNGFCLVNITVSQNETRYPTVRKMLASVE
jgi:hypothetical protein